MTAHVSTSSTLRPTRLAFLVKASDTESMLQAIESTTLLWGGETNPIIPVYASIPKWAKTGGARAQSVAEWVSEHLSFFQVEYVVLGPGIKIPANFEHGRSIALEEFYQSALSGNPKHGLSARHVCDHLYMRRHRFVEHNDQPICTLPPSTERGLHAATVFGVLPPVVAEDYAYYFRGSTRGTLDPNGIIRSFDLRDFTALSMTLYNTGRMRYGTAVVLIYDHHSSRDLSAFWNLRVCTGVRLAVPIHWVNSMRTEMVAAIRSLSVEPDDQGFGGRFPTVVAAPSISIDAVHELVAAVEAEFGVKHINLRRCSGFWEEGGDWSAEYGQREVGAASTLGSVPIGENGTIRVPLLRPDFVERRRIEWNEGWSTHVELDNRWDDDESAVILPGDNHDVGRLLCRFDWDSVRWAGYGLIVDSARQGDFVELTLPTGQELVEWWLKQRGWDSAISGAGRVAARFIRAIGGPRVAHTYCTPEAISAVGQASERESRAASKAELLKWLQAAESESGPAITSSANRFRRLVDRGILRVGLELPCDACGQRGWYSLADVSDDLRCPCCDSTFQFPRDDPPRDQWRYRFQGAFALRQKAHGAFAVALTVSFFYRSSHLECAYSPGVELSKPEDEGRHEVDALMFVSRKGHSVRPRPVLCECKSGRRFGEAELKRATALAEAFPEAILVYAKMDTPTFSRAERERLEKLLRILPDVRATSNRRLSHRPLMLLTSTELHAAFMLTDAWKEAGGRPAAFATMAGYASDWIDPFELCTITQHLYLAGGKAQDDPWFSVQALLGDAGA
ncbi:MAG: hypothetical protein GY722_16355 [bacterium]|nr:hypothetical protein [bacterium]